MSISLSKPVSSYHLLGRPFDERKVELPSGIRLSESIVEIRGEPYEYEYDGFWKQDIEYAGDDMAAVLAMSRKFYATTDDAKHVGMDVNTVSSLIFRCHKNVLLIAEHAGVPVGFFAGLVVPGMFNSFHRALHEVAWYVDPEFTGMGYGTKLIKAADDIRKLSGCWKFEKATLATSPPIADEILINAGFTPSYKSFMKVD